MRRSANGSRVSSTEPEPHRNNQGEKVTIMFNNTTRLPSPDDLGLPGYDVAVSLPNVEDLQSQSNNLFASIKSGDHEAVDKMLAQKGVEVDIVPKIGCSKLFHTKFNLANSETENGDSPLIMAAGVDCRMVKIVLKYGGNPNHANKERHTPLSIAARRYDKEAIDALLLAGANLRAAVVKLTSMLRFMESEDQLRGYCSVKPLTVLLSDDVYLKCRCPIKTAFDVGKDIANIKDVRDEFKTEFELLIEDANEFARTFLKHIDRMWEAREILTFPVDLIKLAIDQKKKKFISHPFCQQIINDRWYGELAHKMFYGRVAVGFKFIFSPWMIIPLFLKYCLIDACRGVPIMQSGLVDLLRLKFTPCLCFCTDVLNYLIFVASLICVCVFQQDTHKITLAEYILYVCVISRIFIELDFVIQQGWRRYLANVWNHVDLILLVLLFIAALYKIGIHAGLFVEPQSKIDDMYNKSTSQNYEAGDQNLEDYKREWSDVVNHYSHFLNVSYIYSMAQLVLAIRILTFLEINRSIGPMLIALKYLLMDVIKFLGVLLCVMLGTSVTIYSMSVRLYRWNDDVNEACLNTWEISWSNNVNHTYLGLLTDAHGLRRINSTELCWTGLNLQPPAFQSFAETLVSIMWSTFGLFDVGVVTEPFDSKTVSFINIILVLYVLLSCVLLLNMLIGILCSTFDKIQENCDVEWKYARSELLKEYSRAQPFLLPFSTLLFPVVYWFRGKLEEENRRKPEKSKPVGDQEERDKIVNEVCRRFAHDLETEESEDEEGVFSRPGTRGGTRPGSRARPPTRPATSGRMLSSKHGVRPSSRRGNFDARVRELRIAGNPM